MKQLVLGRKIFALCIVLCLLVCMLFVTLTDIHPNVKQTVAIILIVLIVPSLLFGLALAIASRFLHYFLVRKTANGKPFNLSPIQRRSITLPMNVNAALDQCSLALHKLPATIIENNLEKNFITAKTEISWKTYGDEIRIDVTKISDEASRVDIISQPFLPAVRIDYGKNYENAEKLLKLLENSKSFIESPTTSETQ